MSFGRRYFSPGQGDSQGPSDEMLAVDAASEIRSLTLLYDRYADRLFRYFFLCTADPQHAERLLRGLLTRLPEELQRFNSEERSFGGWLFARASALVWREYSIPSRLNKWVTRVVPTLSRDVAPVDDAAPHDGPAAGENEILQGLKHIGPSEREVLGATIGAGLSTLAASEALRLPASLLASHVEGALRALAWETGASNRDRLRDDVKSVVERQYLTREQRSAHLALIHGLFHGDVLPEPDDTGRGPMLEIATLLVVVVIGLGGIWVWGKVTTGDTRQHDVPVAAVPEREESTPEPTAEPSPTSPAEETGEARAVDDTPAACLAADGKAVFDRFVRRFNGGDLDGVRAMLPSPSYEHPLLSGDAQSDPEPHDIFAHHDADLAKPDEIIEFLRSRYQMGERWEVLQAFPAEHYRNWQAAAPLEMYQDWKRENPGLGMIIVTGLQWLAPDGREEIASGRVIVDCADEIVIDWDLRPDESQTGELVSIVDFLAAMDPLQPRQAREIRARVQADARDDGGALSVWEVVWSQAAAPDNELHERVDIRTLDGSTVISRVSDGQRWRLDWRGWVAYGDNDDPVIPEEIALSVPWIQEIPGLLGSIADPAGANATTLSEGLPRTEDNPTERTFEVDIDAGAVRAVRVRETTTRGERIRTELTLLSVGRSTGYDMGAFEVGMESGFPETDIHAPRYQVPVDAWPELSTISISVGSDPFREEYRLRWDEVELTLAVRPSRGGLDLTGIPENLDDAWSTAVTDYSYGTLAWAHRQFSGYPTDALWDDGRYRFELVVARDDIEPGDNWNLAELVRLANALSGSSEQVTGVGTRHRGRSMDYPVPSMFHYR